MTAPKQPNLDDLESLSEEERRARRLTLPPGEDYWVFGYGSLMWHPGFPHLEVRLARLRGLHRSFCVYSHRYRGTPQAPGLVLGLDRGGSCHGMVFRGWLEILSDRQKIDIGRAHVLHGEAKSRHRLAGDRSRRGQRHHLRRRP